MATAEKVVVQKPDENVAGLRERAVIAKFQAKCWSGQAKDFETTENIRQQNGIKKGEKFGTFSKILMERKFAPLHRVIMIITEARAYHKKVTFRWGDAEEILPAAEVLVYKQKMRAWEQDFIVSVNEFMIVFRQSIKEQRDRLQGLFRESDYPSEEAMLRKFNFVHLISPIPTSDDFRLKLSKVTAEELKADYEDEIRGRMKGTVHDVYELVRKEVEDLQKKSGDPKVNVQAKSFGPLRRLVTDVLPQLNSIVQDPEIAKLCDTLQKDLLAVDTSNGALKTPAKKAAFKAKVKVSADNLLASLKPLQQQQTVQ